MKHIIVFVLLISLVFPVYSQYIWPVKDTKVLESVFTVFDGDVICTMLGITDTVLSMSEGTVQVVRDHMSEGLPSMIIIKHSDNILAKYLYIDPHVRIGEKVQRGDHIGDSLQDEVCISLYDQTFSRRIDPLLVLPELDRYILISRKDIIFNYKDHKVSINTSRRIDSGSTTIQLLFTVRDRNSNGYIMPYHVEVSIGAQQFFITREQIVSSEFDSTYNRNGVIEVVLSNIVLPKGYFDIVSRVVTPLSGDRTFRTNVFAR